MPELDGRLAVLNPHLHDGVPLVEAARRAGVPRRTASRLLAAYQSNGLEGRVAWIGRTGVVGGYRRR